MDSEIIIIGLAVFYYLSVADFNHCRRGICQNGGTCKHGTPASCVCKTGYVGRRCDSNYTYLIVPLLPLL